ncbi:hypothetical protein NE237_032683 [Protea cynaroides]|uniref:Cell division cycle protein 123 homolog n=1 Tax=Protea cynaroides TaxID=273540 RepID=A0A9Q0L4X3_9MAGN|nr:hypothetical protein NE237_032683 [Protea cynaroides]
MRTRMYINNRTMYEMDRVSEIHERRNKNPKEAEVNRCQIQEWYPKFKSVSVKTLIHDHPEPFVCYLLEESGPFMLPQSISGDDALPRRIYNSEEEEDYEVSEGSGDESERPPPAPCFPELELKIKESINTLGGAVFPKLIGVHQMTAWITTTGTLCCTSFSEIALVLRSSDSLIHDLCHAYNSCSIKTSSRPTTFLHSESGIHPFSLRWNSIALSVIVDLLVSRSVRDNVQPRFESENYTLDVYVTRDGKVKLMDFNPWEAFTLLLLFSWEELEQSFGQDGDYIDFRIIESRWIFQSSLRAMEVDNRIEKQICHMRHIRSNFTLGASTSKTAMPHFVGAQLEIKFQKEATSGSTKSVEDNENGGADHSGDLGSGRKRAKHGDEDETS